MSDVTREEMEADVEIVARHARIGSNYNFPLPEGVDVEVYLSLLRERLGPEYKVTELAGHKGWWVTSPI